MVKRWYCDDGVLDSSYQNGSHADEIAGSSPKTIYASQLWNNL